ncbi:MAG: nucleotidyltransferase [Flavobacteriales bacterium]|nr:nucleotidyltransferase [Flavobacteriales bacterium]
MPTNKSEYLQDVLSSHKMNHVQTLMDKYLTKRDFVKAALSLKYSDKKATEPINSGSYAKHTAINTKFDIDVCIPFKRNSFDTLEKMADDVYTYFQNEYVDSQLIKPVRKQRVSVGLTFVIDGEEIQMDIVPGREINVDEYSNTNDLKLFVRKKDEIPASETKTNIKKHIDHVSGKNAERDITRLLKIWKVSNSKKYKSFFIELFTIRAFEYNSSSIPNGLWPKLEMVMKFIRENAETIQLKDPANSNNIVSDTLTAGKKTSLANDMKNMLRKIEEDSDNIRLYFPINDDFGSHPNSSNEQSKNTGPSVLKTRSFG